jgi:hypothetical protein
MVSAISACYARKSHPGLSSPLVNIARAIVEYGRICDIHGPSLAGVGEEMVSGEMAGEEIGDGLISQHRSRQTNVSESKE